jgi:hypothetical protein
LAYIYPGKYGNTSIRNVGVLQPGLQEVTSQKLVLLIFHYFLREIVKTVKSPATIAGLSEENRKAQGYLTTALVEYLRFSQHWLCLLEVLFMLFYCLLYYYTLKMEVEYSYESSFNFN